MADFFQTGAIATLHRLGPTDLGRLEAELCEFAKDTPIALVLPCHVRELGTPALRLILKELRGVSYLKEIVVGIDGASARDWWRARRIFGNHPREPILLWNNGPRIQRIYTQLQEADLDIGPPGKGRNVWTCFGHVLASEKATMVATHDCDITTYNRELLARLCYPVAHPHLGFDFCKGYTARYTNKLHGRVMRLLFTPLMRSLETILGLQPLLVYLDTFRYPLSGEMCLDLDLVRRVRVPSDWGIEVGMLAEVFRNSAARAICQSELSERYDHKHQELSMRDADKGLNKMAVDITKTIFRVMAAEGIKLDTGLFDTLLSAYVRRAEDTLRHYNADAAINGLNYGRHEEEQAVATFAKSIRVAARSFSDDPLGTPLIPNWNRVQSALPNLLEELKEAVRRDNA
ncbi:MAG TPA: glycosyl transferase [Verrucomicrobiota bacterium]|nr:glycosyl transferase [Verrucomicrobiales bacterium]HRI13040.1 glycosyl transferase [Verrucomicrobiota bacterium]